MQIIHSESSTGRTVLFVCVRDFDCKPSIRRFIHKTDCFYSILFCVVVDAGGTPITVGWWSIVVAKGGQKAALLSIHPSIHPSKQTVLILMAYFNGHYLMIR